MTATKRPARIAVVYPIPFGPDGLFGGGERNAFELARALSAYAPTELLTFGPRARDERRGNLRLRTYRALKFLRGERINPLSFRFLAAVARADVIHCTVWNTLVSDLAVLVGSALGKATFLTDIGGGGSLTVTERLRVTRRVSRFLLMTTLTAEQFEPYRERWRMIYGGVDIERFAPQPGHARQRDVLFVGRLLPHKGVNYLIDALDPGVSLTVLGRPYDERYFALLQELARGKDVRFVLDADDAAVAEAYRSHRVCVLPSVLRDVYGVDASAPELLGYASMEAMASGTPTIVTDIGGFAAFVRDGVEAFVVPPSDAHALRQRIRTLLGDAELRERMGAAGQALVERDFSWPAVARRCIAAYNEVLPPHLRLPLTEERSA